MTQGPKYGRIDGAIVMIGFGSIGRGTLPLIERHFDFDKSLSSSSIPTIPIARCSTSAASTSSRSRITRDNYREVLGTLPDSRQGPGLLRQSLGRHVLARHHEARREIGALYVDTVVEPWPGFYFDKRSATRRAPITRCARPCWPSGARIRAARPRSPAAAPIPAWCPGSSSRRWSISPRISATRAPEPKTRDEWGALAQRLGVKGIHIAERDTQRAKMPKPRDVFVNTWSVEGFLSEGMQPAELGWGTHEKWPPRQRRLP